MNTEAQIPPVQSPPIPPPEIPTAGSDTGVPPPPPPEIIPAPEKKGMTPLTITVIILAVLALGGGLAFFALPQLNLSTVPIPSPTSIPQPTVTERPAGLSLQASDDPAILEKELNDINLDILDQEEAEINLELTNL